MESFFLPPCPRPVCNIGLPYRTYIQGSKGLIHDHLESRSGMWPEGWKGRASGTPGCPFHPPECGPKIAPSPVSRSAPHPDSAVTHPRRKYARRKALRWLCVGTEPRRQAFVKMAKPNQVRAIFSDCIVVSTWIAREVATSYVCSSSYLITHSCIRSGLMRTP